MSSFNARARAEPSVSPAEPHALILFVRGNPTAGETSPAERGRKRIKIRYSLNAGEKKAAAKSRRPMSVIRYYFTK